MAYDITRIIMGVNYQILISIIFCVAIMVHPHLQADSDHELGETLTEVSMRNNCIYPGEILTYECTVLGEAGGLTIWMGDFFHCSSGKQVIELVHNQFTGEASNNRICNNGKITARIVRVENGSFTSQLNVTVSSDIAGKTIDCAYDNGRVHRVGSINLTTDIVDINSQPQNINLTASCSLSGIYFNWDASPSNCPSTFIYYDILAPNCVSCPQATANHTNITCRMTNKPTYDSLCNFSVRSAFSVQPAVCYSEWQNKPFKILLCPDESGPETLLLMIILPLITLLLVLFLLVCHIFKKKPLSDLCNCCQKAFHRSVLFEEQNIENHGGKYLAEDDTKAIKIFDNELNGTYNLKELDAAQREIQESMQGGSLQLTLDKLLIKLQGQVSSNWHKFGLAIGTPDDIMEQLIDYSDKDALVEILDYWLRNHHSGQPTWQDIATALKKAGCNVE